VIGSFITTILRYGATCSSVEVGAGHFRWVVCATSDICGCWPGRRVSAWRTKRQQRKGAPPYDTSERPRGGLRSRLQSVAKAKPPGIEAVSSTSVANCTGSIGQYGAGSQVAHESGQSKILELRSQRQADATNSSEWTQAGLAQKVGASVRSVKAWEAGDTLPRLFYRRRLAKALGVSVSDLGF